MTEVRVVKSLLPDCPETGYKNNCYGIYKSGFGDLYEGEWKNNLKHGLGFFTQKQIPDNN